MCRISCSTCAGAIFDGNRRRNGKWKDDVCALSNYIPPDEAADHDRRQCRTKIQGIANLVRLEAKMANTEGATSITIRDLIKTALRMRPDHIIVGEVREAELSICFRL